MKRTKDINHSNFRKAYRSFRIAPVSLAVATVLVLSGCEANEEVKASVYRDAEECIANNPKLVDTCKASYESSLAEAEKTAPKYATKEDCEAEFGAGSCGTGQTQGTNSEYRQGSIWMPLMMGYMMGRMSGGGFGNSPMFTSKTASSPAYGKYVDSTGRSYGSTASKNMTVDRSAFAPKPATTQTITRGGFGQSVNRMSAAQSSSGKSTSANRSATSSSRTVGG